MRSAVSIIVSFAAVSAIIAFSFSTSAAPGLSRAERVEIFHSLRRALDEKYALLDIKRKTIGVDPLRVVEACAAEEARVRASRFESLAFYDRLRSCLARLKDYHLEASEQTPRPALHTGIQLKRIGDRFFIASVHPRLLDYSEDLNRAFMGEWKKSLIPGAEVSAIDGRSPSGWIRDFKRYVSAGSEAAAEESALAAITFRAFRYPVSGVQRLKVVGQAEEIRLHWWSLDLNQREDARESLRGLGILSVQRIEPGFDLKIRNEIGSRGYSDRKPLGDSGSFDRYTDPKSGRVALSLGVAKLGAREICYAQIHSFEPKVLRAETGETVSFLRPVQALLSICKARSLEFILDLRENSGGNVDNMHGFLALLLKPGQTAPTTWFSGRLTRSFIELMEKYNLGDGISIPDQSAYSPELRYQALRHALKNRERYLPFIPERNLVADLSLGGYSGKILALTGPKCASSCEILLGLLRAAGRAKFLGQAANGTGSGFLRIGEYPRPEWRDDLHGSVVISIPNGLYGAGARTMKPGEYFLDFRENVSVLRENRPIEADEAYSLRLDDLTSGGEAWLKRAFEMVDADQSADVIQIAQ